MVAVAAKKRLCSSVVFKVRGAPSGDPNKKARRARNFKGPFSKGPLKSRVPWSPFKLLNFFSWRARAPRRRHCTLEQKFNSNFGFLNNFPKRQPQTPTFARIHVSVPVK
jgi:hypothetical protein